MSAFVIELTEEELFKQTSCTNNALSLDFQNASFKKGPTFSTAMREQALKYCQKFVTKKFKSLLVENKYSFTVWVQQESAKTQKKESNSKSAISLNELVKNIPDPTQEAKNSNSEQISSQQPSVSKEETNVPTSIPTKKVVRRYRGQTYEVEVPDYPALMQLAQRNQNKPRRKYRGQYVD